MKTFYIALAKGVVEAKTPLEAVEKFILDPLVRDGLLFCVLEIGHGELTGSWHVVRGYISDAQPNIEAVFEEI